MFLTKTEEQMLKNRKATNHNRHQKQKTKVFWPKTKTYLQNNLNCKTKIPNVPLVPIYTPGWNERIHVFEKQRVGL